MRKAQTDIESQALADLPIVLPVPFDLDESLARAEPLLMLVVGYKVTKQGIRVTMPRVEGVVGVATEVESAAVAAAAWSFGQCTLEINACLEAVLAPDFTEVVCDRIDGITVAVRKV